MRFFNPGKESLGVDSRGCPPPTSPPPFLCLSRVPRFMTGVKQTYSRDYKIAIDTLTIGCQVQTTVPSATYGFSFSEETSFQMDWDKNYETNAARTSRLSMSKCPRIPLRSRGVRRCSLVGIYMQNIYYEAFLAIIPKA